MRIVILGGSFDPIHKGHLQIAKAALAQHIGEAVWFMPTFDTPLKQQTSTPFQDRLKMIECAIKPYRKMKLCNLEIMRKGCSYTIDSVKQLQKMYPKDTFLWLIGSDQAQQLSKWKDIDELYQLIQFYVYPRNQIKMDAHPQLKQLALKEIDISSSQVRKGDLTSLAYPTRSYIGEHYLYLESLVQSCMSEKRYQHSVSVAKLCVELAKCHKVDPQKAYVAGMLHDVCKEWPRDKAERFMKCWESDKCTTPMALWHADLASHHVERFYKIKDREILFAIAHHVIGSTKQKLAMILFIADKLDPSRGYDSSSEIEQSKKNLRAGYDLVKQQQQTFLKKEGK
ncbi:MAG: nicotinate (nicotinamide) nucleotide adenylyltransferase [Erysipelotrichaceae bacterium]